MTHQAYLIPETVPLTTVQTNPQHSKLLFILLNGELLAAQIANRILTECMILNARIVHTAHDRFNQCLN